MNAQKINDNYADQITGAYNKAFFFESGNYALQLAIRGKIPLTLCIVDIDNLETINTKYGYDAGNKILAFVTQTIRDKCRKSDLVGYIGDGKLGLLLYNISGINTQLVLDELRQKIDYKKYKINTQEVDVTVSIGACVMNSYMNTESLDSIYEQAFRATNIAKDKGKNRVVVY